MSSSIFRGSNRQTRRHFLQNVSSAAALSVMPCFAEIPYDDSPSALADDPLRPQFHLLPAANWMNDPNGPIYWHGQYHMFFQYNPHAAVWGDMHWAHAVSLDMVHWKHLPIALAPTPGGADRDGCFTGSAVDDGGTATFLYTGVAAAPPEQATLRDGVHNFRETQLLATSSDPDLRNWKKLAQPVIEPPRDPLLTGFRDPFLWKDSGNWYLGVASGQRKEGGRILLYRSSDLRHWDSAGVLASGKWNGKQTADVVDSGEMWECPDFFPLGKKHVLIYSTERKVYWQTGELDRREMKFHAEKSGLLDSGAYYAPKTQTAANDNRILWGWITEKRSDDALRQAGWAGCMSLPRVLSLDAENRLVMSPAPELTTLRAGEFSMPMAIPAAERLPFLRQLRIDDLSAEISLQINAAPFSISLVDGPEAFLTLSYDPAKTGAELSLNDTAIAVRARNLRPVSLRMFIDGSVVELFVDDHFCHTARVYRAPKNSLSLEISELSFAALVALRAWHLAPISPDRLTT